MPKIMSLDGEGLARVVEECAKVLDGGGLAIVPTDTVYGLAARVDDSAAARKIFELKGREADKALVVMVSSVVEAARLVASSERESLLSLGSLWPGPLTLVAGAGDVAWKPNVAPLSDNIGIRVPASSFLLRLLDITGPLAVTSANFAGGKSPASFQEIDRGLVTGVDIAVDGGECGSGKPSTIAELSGDTIEVLRPGEIGEEDLYAALEKGKAR